jgi:hypothetical protein
LSDGGILLTVPVEAGCNGSQGEIDRVTPSAQIIDLNTKLFNNLYENWPDHWNTSTQELKECTGFQGYGGCNFYRYKDGELRKIRTTFPK